MPDAGLFLKVIYDALNPEVQFIVSGSSSLEIAHSSEFLTGRKVTFELSPFSFKEFLVARSQLRFNADFSSADFSSILDFQAMYKDELQAKLAEYALYGGYPQIVLEKEVDKKKILLKELVTTYIQKDVSGFLKIENISGFNHLFRLLVNQIGNLINKSELANITGLS